MRNDTDRWAPPPNFAESFTITDLTIQVAPVQRLTLVSGPKTLSQSSLPQIGWPKIVTHESFALVLRRDRMLEVNGPARPEGWDDATSLAVSDVTDGSIVLHMDGEKALPLLARGAELELDVPSKSVARSVFGYPIVLYRYASKTGFALHVPRAFAPAFWSILLSNANTM